MKRWHKPISCIILLCLLITLFSNTIVEAAAGIKILNYSTGKTTTYTGQQVKYVCNGASVSISDTPGIIEKGYSLGSYEDIFQNCYGISCSFNSDKNKITMKHNNITITLTLGSETAYVNGTAKKMGIAPVKVKYMANGKEKILVPTRFIAETFNINYSWKSSTSTVTMYKKTTLIYNNKENLYTGVFGQIYCDGKRNDNNKVPVVKISDSVMVSAYDVMKNALNFSYNYNANTNSITLSQGDITLEMTLENTIAYVNGEVVNCGTAPLMVSFKEYGKDTVLVPAFFIAQIFNYDYYWDTASKTAYITSTSKSGIWKESVLNNLINESDINNTANINSLETFFNSEPVETYLSLYDAPISDEYKDSVNKLNNESIYGLGQANQKSLLTGINKDNNAIADTETYLINFTSPIYEVENLGFNENDLLLLRIPNSVCSNRFYDLQGEFITNISTGISETKDCTEIQVLLKSNSTNYNISLSEDNMQLIITVYKNYLTDILFGKNESDIEFVQIKSLFPLYADIAYKGNYIVMTINNNKNPFGNKYYKNLNSDTLRSINVVSGSQSEIYIHLEKKEGKDILYTEVNDNVLTIYLSDKNINIEKTDTEKKSFWNIINNLEIKLPVNVSASDITTEDRYYNRQIIITLPGSHKEFFKNNPISSSYEVVTDIKVNEKPNNTTDIIITTDVVRGFEIIDNDDFITIRLANPKEFYDKIVVLDAGHGGVDPGATKNNINEKDLNFTILNKYTAEYFKDSDIKIYYTRVTDTLIDLYDRAAFATEVSADFFVSLHMNANNSSSVNGTGVYYSKNNKNKTESGLTSLIMAQTFANNLSAAIKTKNNGVITGEFVVIRDTQVPAVLIELAFMTNSNDLKKLTSANVQKTAAKTIYNTIVSLFEKYPTYR